MVGTIVSHVHLTQKAKGKVAVGLNHALISFHAKNAKLNERQLNM